MYMQVINWLELEPLPADLDALGERLHEALPLRKVCQLLVEITLRAFPWSGRTDLIPSYHPSQTYTPGQKIALLLPESQNAHRMVWFSAQVQQTKTVENPVQGRFQVLTLDSRGKHVQMAGGIPDASYPELNLPDYTPEDLARLVDWITDTYAAALQVTLRKLIQQGKLRGQLAGQTFLPEDISAISLEFLHPLFARLSPARAWTSLEDLLKGLPDLSRLGRETALGLLRATLTESPYQALGADRWTTPEIFNQFNRDVPHGLTTPHIRSKVSIWTKRDEQDLAGYGRKFMPAEARRVLEELESGERLPEPDDSPWRPPPRDKPVRLPTLNYLHMTQAYFPVGDVLRVFAPDMQMVFLQFIDGEHQPFLLDRENGLLKAMYPEKVRAKILNDGIPAGIHLWLEYERNEKYRIAPRPLPFKRMIPCRLASLEDGRLHIQPIQISMKYEGDPSLFKADLRNEEVEALFAEARRVNLRVLDAMIYAVQEICSTDPNQRAHWLDIFNAVFLTRVCSPNSISFLLYTQPCFEPLGGGYFRYKPTPNATTRKNPKQMNRLSQLWEGLLSNPLPPDPLAKDKIAVRPRLEVSIPVAPAFRPDLELPTNGREGEPEPEISTKALTLAVVVEDRALKSKERIESFLVSPEEPESFQPIQMDIAEPESHPWRDSLDKLLHALEELQDPERLEETNPETEAPSGLPDESIPKESISLASPFRWEPKPAWIYPPNGQKPPFPEAVDPRRFVYKPKIPLRPFHKQRFYRRFVFYLRGWLTRIFQRTV